ncbi:2-methylcitrate dehydratase [Nadsonia fulvescens var. elongata DSM 6958]|uniref:2-methylcitrate dehydratase n=1 Tax=Nadsonia fulvescens var. elongata DSM 6958 TaxID=857566 RepID=A0A1E3PHD6_9ASCO|nr:2-methylcitrate dehydratase [Nadsonia fulvescens var. elongata DSM 6958]
MSTQTTIYDNARPQPDKVLRDISEYVHNYKIDSPLALKTARLCLLDTLGCGLEGLKYQQCANLAGPVVPGTIVPNGVRVPGTNHILDPVRGAFSIGTIIRWLDFNDCWLAAEWGHPSDNLGGILAVADWMTRTAKAEGSGKVFKIKDVLEAMIKAHEIQGILALENSFNKVGLDHVVLVKVATTAVVSKMLGLSYEQTIDALSQAFVDGQSLRTYRHAPNTMSRKSWAAGDAVSRAVNLALIVKGGEQGMPSVLTAKTWGFYDVLFKGKEFKFQRGYGSYVMENVLFKISFPAEFHAQTAVEAAMTLHETLKAQGKTSDDIASIRIRTQEAGMRIINKSGPLHNYADRDHCIQYMVAIPLIHGRLTADDYSDTIAADPRVDELRAKMECVEEERFTTEYHAPEKRFIGNAVQITLNDGTILEEVEVNYPIGHRKRREEGTPVLLQKFDRHLRGRFGEAQVKMILEKSQEGFEEMDVDDYVNLYVKKD